MKSFLGKTFSKIVSTKVGLLFFKYVVAKISFRFLFRTPFKVPTSRYCDLLSCILSDKHDNPNSAYAFVNRDDFSLESLSVDLVCGSKAYSHAGWIFPTIHDTVAMTSKGLTKKPLSDIMGESDRLAIVRFNLTDIEKFKSVMIDFMMSQPEYDFSEDLGNSPNLVYCSELIYMFRDLFTDEISPKFDFGRLIFSPQQVRESGKLIWEFK